MESMACLEAVLAVQDTLDGLFPSVKVVNNGLGVLESASRENKNIINLVHFLQKLLAVRPDVNPALFSTKIQGHISTSSAD